MDTQNNNSFFALVFRQKYISRWAMMRNSCDERLSTHTAECAILTHALCTIANVIFGKNIDTERAVSAALFHDATEVLTGDLPTPVKYYNSDIKNSYKELEIAATRQLVSKLPPELQKSYSDILSEDDAEIHRIVKSADKLCAYIKCIEEQKCGNDEFRLAGEATLKSLEEYKSEELDYFIEKLLPAFFETLDEL